MRYCKSPRVPSAATMAPRSRPSLWTTCPAKRKFKPRPQCRSVYLPPRNGSPPLRLCARFHNPAPRRSLSATLNLSRSPRGVANHKSFRKSNVTIKCRLSLNRLNRETTYSHFLQAPASSASLLSSKKFSYFPDTSTSLLPLLGPAAPRCPKRN